LKAKGLEVVFVTGDRDEDSFKEYFNEQPWLAVDFNAKEQMFCPIPDIPDIPDIPESQTPTTDVTQETLSKLNKTFKVQGIPSLIILDADGKLITKDGREAVSKDPTGEDMPWPLGMTV
jgi:nucleoredoxin